MSSITSSMGNLGTKTSLKSHQPCFERCLKSCVAMDETKLTNRSASAECAAGKMHANLSHELRACIACVEYLVDASMTRRWGADERDLSWILFDC